MALAALTGVVTLTLAIVGMGTASASTLNGVATTATPSNDNYLASGGSNTDFTLTLPSGAACTGDTAHDGYHVWGATWWRRAATITSTTFSDSTGPSQGLRLFESDLNYYGPANTAQTTGQIIGIPNDFQWGAGVSGGSFTAAQLLYTGGTSGIWEGGLACANSSGVLTDNWNTQITFTKAASDPNGFTWSAVPGTAGALAISTTSLPSATIGTPYSGVTLAASGGTSPYKWKVTGLPKGLRQKSGVISGEVKASRKAPHGPYTVTITVSDKSRPKQTATKTLTLTLNPA